MVFAPLDVARGKPEIIANKVIKIELRRQKQGQRIKQTGLPTRSPDQDVILLQHQRQTIDTAKTDGFFLRAQEAYPLRYTTTLLQ